MSQEPIEPNPGSELDPKNFVGRAETMRRAFEMLDAGQNIILNDPRRMGKTFWMVTFAAEMENTDQLQVVWIDYMGVDTVDEFLRKTVDALVKLRSMPEQVLKYLGGLFENVSGEAASGPLKIKAEVRQASALELLGNVLTKVDEEIGACKQLPLVIAMDEVPDAVDAIMRKGCRDDGLNLLERLRTLRLSSRNVRWILAGSIGFHHVLQGREDLVNDLNPLPFGPLRKADAVSLAQRLALGIGRELGAGAADAMAEITDCWPYLIQKLFDAMKYDEHGEADHTEVIAEEVQRRFDAFVADRDQSRDVTQFVSRIEEHYGAGSKLAYAILDATATGPHWRPIGKLPADLRADELFLEVFGKLQDDHYLLVRGDEVGWRYQVIRTIYRQRRMLK
ncbi:MAG: hypothetical protein LBR21_05570 [Propionibacteriaceae bacterium]|nr:hypothetical protein [Propionibacteriaceae bacterium]